MFEVCHNPKYKPKSFDLATTVQMWKSCLYQFWQHVYCVKHLPPATLRRLEPSCSTKLNCKHCFQVLFDHFSLILMTPVCITLLSGYYHLLIQMLHWSLWPWTPTYWCSSSGSRCPACGKGSPHGVRCVSAAGALPGCSGPEQTWIAASLPLLALWVVVGAAVWVCPELEAGRDGKTFLVSH